MADLCIFLTLASGFLLSLAAARSLQPKKIVFADRPK